MAQDVQADVVLALAPDLLLEPGDGLEVVVEDLGAGREDDVDAIGAAVEIGREHLDGRTGSLADARARSGESARRRRRPGHRA